LRHCFCQARHPAGIVTIGSLCLSPVPVSIKGNMIKENSLLEGVLRIKPDT
jgi:hypothetical protein